MSRSIWKEKYVSNNILKVKDSKKKIYVLKTFSRNSTILPSFIGLEFKIYNGFTFRKVIIDKTMIGQKLGEFVRTRQFPNHKKKKKKK